MKWQIRQLEKLSETDPDRFDLVLEKMFDDDSDLQEEVIVGAYLDGDINFSKAAELLTIDPETLRHRFLNRGIPVRLGLENIEDLQAEIRAAEQIFDSK